MRWRRVDVRVGGRRTQQQAAATPRALTEHFPCSQPIPVFRISRLIRRKDPKEQFLLESVKLPRKHVIRTHPGALSPAGLQDQIHDFSDGTAATAHPADIGNFLQYNRTSI